MSTPAPPPSGSPNTPPLTTAPVDVEILWDSPTKKWLAKSRWFKPWFDYFNANQKQINRIEKDVDILAALLLPPRDLEEFKSAQLLAAALSPSSGGEGGSEHTIPLPVFPAQPAQDLSAALIALATQRKWSDIRVIQDTFANRQAAAAYPEGSFFISTTAPSKGVVWVARTVSGTRQWIYESGYWRADLSGLPTSSLTASDADLLWEVTDYDHILKWSGSAWGWGTGNPSPSGIYGLCETAPTTAGWQICDGSTVARLNADATTTNVTVPNVGTAAYLKGGTSAAAVAAASGTTAAESAHTHAITTPTGAPSATQEVQSGTGVTVAGSAHTHDVTTPTGAGSAHTHGPGTLELRSKQAILYYRR